MPQPEAQLQKKIRTALLEAFPGSVIWKIHGGPMQYAGIPDLVGCVCGHFVGIEVKLPGKEHTLTDRQAFAIRSIQRAGGLAGVATSAEEALDIVDPLELLR